MLLLKSRNFFSVERFNFVIWGGLIFVQLFLLNSAAFASTSSDNLAAYWKFDETIAASSAADSSGDGNTGTPSGSGGSQSGPQPSSDVPSSITFTDPRSLNFDGTDDDVAVSGLITGSSQVVTLAAWVNLTLRDTSGSEIISLGDHVLLRADDSSSQKTTGQFYNGTTWIGTGSGVDIAGSGWRHVAYVVHQVSGNFYQQIYIDGVLDTQSTNSTSIVYSGLSQNTKIGEHGNGSSNYNFNGNIDDVRVYTRALSASEIADLAAGDHTSATWDGSSSTDNEAAANWDINAVPDPYTNLIIASTANQPVLTADLTAASLTINNGATFTTNCFAISYNDGGGLTNNGTYVPCPSNNTSTTSSSLSPPGIPQPYCGDSPPNGTPDLFQSDASGTSVILYFTTINNANGYSIEYGFDQNADQFGDFYSYNGPEWIQSRKISNLAPNTAYFFRIRGVNGCNAGDYSQVIQIRTGSKSFWQSLSEIISGSSSKLPSQKSLVSDCHYTVQEGDTLWGVAFRKWQKGSEYLVISRINNLSDDKLKIGQTLNLCS